MRKTNHFVPEDYSRFKENLLTWAEQFEEVIWLDSNAGDSPYKKYEGVLAVEAFTAIKTDSSSAFENLREYQEQTKDWIFGYLSYDLKNDLEEDFGKLHSENFDGLQFPELYFFQPKKLFFLNNGEVELQYLGISENEMESDLQEIRAMSDFKEKKEVPALQIVPRISKENYLDKADHLLELIRKEVVSEVNFCQEFYAENAEIEALETYKNLNELSAAPFAAFIKLEEYHALCASPERYLQRNGNKLITQPIKGTAKRSTNLEEDVRLAENLKSDPKEISENKMVVDLVCEELSQTAIEGSVKVEELCGVYSFKQVHQLISTISSEISDGTSNIEILKSTFPMGSMTGVPSAAALQIIEDIEETKRGLYSGAIGYFTPDGDFDFNVVIRSILYNSQKKYASFSVGSAITAKCVPEKEYEECLVKAKAMHQVLAPFTDIEN